MACSSIYSLSLHDALPIYVLVGIIWQTSLVAAPIFMVIKHWPEFGVAMLIIAITSVFLYFNWRSEEHTSELQSRGHLVCRLLLEKKKINSILFKVIISM